MSNLLNGMKNELNYTETFNGGTAYKSTLNGVLDLFAMGGALRCREKQDKIDLFYRAFEEDKLLAMKCLFYLRDREEGLGERETFKNIIVALANSNPDIVKLNLHLIPFYGRWDDLLPLLDTPLKEDVCELIEHTLTQDLDSNGSVSLCAKWMPTVSTNNKEKKHYLKILVEHFGFSGTKGSQYKQYRQIISTLRKKINIVETLMSQGKWDEIDYSKVPSVANRKYINAFYNHDEERYSEYLDSVNKGEAKINTKVLYPYEIVRDVYKEFYYLNADNVKALDTLWNNLPNYVSEGQGDTLVMADTSGSMTCNNGTPLFTAVSLALYFAERNTGEFANHFMTFDRNPALVEIKGDTILDKIRRCFREINCWNTNIEGAFDLILNTAIRNKLSQEELPSRLVIISDMEFDAASGELRGQFDRKTVMEEIRTKYEVSGYEMPRLVFWNVNSMQNNIPMKVEDGIQFVSGSNPKLFEYLAKGEFFGAIELMLSVLEQPRYDDIRIA